MEPEIRYAKHIGVSIAYEVVGDGPIDLVCLSPADNLEIVWENPLYARYLRGLSAFARLVLIDRRGTGLSDRFSPADLPTIEDLVDDILAVLDDLGCERAVVFGFSDAASQCAMFAASHPERVAGLILYAPAVCGTPKPDFPWTWSEEEWAVYLDGLSQWGTDAYARATLSLFNPSHVGDGRVESWWRRFQRLSCSPSGILAIETMFRDLDIRPIMPTIGVKTLALHRTGDRIEPVGQSRYIADQIPDARFVELPGEDHMPWAGDQDALVAEIGRFLHDVQGSEEVSDRVLGTILFTDIVGSTERAAALGDVAWKAVLAAHDDVARHEVERFRGRLVGTTGDGLLAMFDGPARAVRAARAVGVAVARLGLEIRAGCHTGEVELAGDDVRGLAVHIAARVAALAGGSEIWTTSTVKDLTAGSGLVFTDAGEHDLKGVPDRWRLFRASDNHLDAHVGSAVAAVVLAP
jgi:pimeloyl-ACP methyl ester carboxylesterase